MPSVLQTFARCPSQFPRDAPQPCDKPVHVPKAFRGVRSPSLHQIAHSRLDVPLFASQAIVDRAEGRLPLDILVEHDMDLAAGALFEARNRTRAPVHTPRSVEKMPAPLAQAAPVREEHSPQAVLAVCWY